MFFLRFCRYSQKISFNYQICLKNTFVLFALFFFRLFSIFIFIFLVKYKIKTTKQHKNPQTRMDTGFQLRCFYFKNNTKTTQKQHKTHFSTIFHQKSSKIPKQKQHMRCFSTQKQHKNHTLK